MTSRSDDFPREDLPKRFDVYRAGSVCFGLLLLLLLIYHNSFTAAFQFDDHPNIVQNPDIHLKTLSLSEIRKTFFVGKPPRQMINRPLVRLTFGLNYFFGKLDVFGYPRPFAGRGDDGCAHVCL